ncbi:ATP-binding cassette domain-containing protein, partial [Proteus mirabilis]|uniref:ATP-binding cassette domain-containing protein n=1 Tax=Proteus mirabilis TaxID=584 RepID=UPI0013D4437D
LASRAQMTATHLSHGEQRQLEIAMVLATQPRIILLDEPLAPLDAARRAAFGALMAEHLAGGGLILAAVHDPLPIAAREAEIGA